MSDFSPIDTAGLSDRALMEALARGMNATHACVDTFRKDQAQVNEEARGKRHALSNGISRLQGAMLSLNKRLGKVESAQEIDSGRITKLSQMLGAEKVAKGEKKPKGGTLATISVWKALGTVLGCLSGVVLLIQLLAPAVTAFAVAFAHSIMAHQ